MLDTQGRITIGKELILRANLKEKQKVDIFLDNTKRALVLFECNCVEEKSRLYYVATHTLDEKGRLFIPADVRDAFPGATYLSTEKDGMIYILIYEH